MQLSVIIPTRDRVVSLRETLKSLVSQKAPPFETLIVDNSPQGTGRKAVEDFRDSWIPGTLAYIHHPQGGLAEARNRGVREANGDLLVFSDDDVLFSPGWLNGFLRRFQENPSMLAASGKVLPSWSSPPPDWLVGYLNEKERYGILAILDRGDDFTLGTQNELWGCNMALRREVFRWTGFHPELYGDRTLGDGESGLASDIRKHEGEIGYIPEAVVYHRIPSERMSLDYIKKWAWHWSGCYMFQRWHRKPTPPISLAKETWRIMRDFTPYWIRLFTTRQHHNPEAIDVRFMASLGRAQLTYLWWILTDPFLKELLARESFAPLHNP